MQIVGLSEKDKQDYNQFVVASTTGSFLQSWEWGQWQESLGRGVFRYWLLDESQKKIGSIQFIKMPLPLGKYYLYAPYGPVLSEGENFKFKISNFKEEIQKQFPEAIFIRVEPKDLSLIPDPCLPDRQDLSFTKSPNIQPGKTLIINLSKSAEELLGQMHHKTRYNIRLAQKHGVEIKDEFDITVGHGLFAKEAAGLIVETAARQGYKGHSAGYYERLVDFFAVQNRTDLSLHIYKAIFQNKLLASAIMVDFGSVRVFLFGGSSDEHKNVMAPYLLHWRAIQDAKAAGLSFYDFWGVETSSGQTAGFVRFKFGFAPQTALHLGLKEYAGAYDMALRPQWYWWYKLFRFARKLFK